MDKLLLLSLSILGAFIGSFVAHFLRSRAWRRETIHTLQKARYEEGVGFLDELSKLVGRRFFLLQRLVWTLQDDPANETKCNEREKDYYAAVADWNFTYWSNRNKVRLLAGDKFANEFLDYSDDRKGGNPSSLHYKFRAAHEAMRKIAQGTALAQETAAPMRELNKSCSIFLERLTHEFLERASHLQLFDIPKNTLKQER